VAGVYRS